MPTRFHQLTTGTIRRSVYRVAAPAILGTLVHHLYHVVDMFWVGRMPGQGAAAQAALSGALMVMILFFASVDALGVGVNALIARGTGARDEALVRRTAAQTIVHGLWVGIVLALVFRWLSPVLLEAMGLRAADAEVFDLGVRYLQTLFLFAPIQYLHPLVEYLFKGRGDTTVPLILNIAALTLNFVLNPIFILGEALVPRLAGGLHFELIPVGFGGWGVEGAALATALSYAVALVLALILLFAGRLQFRPTAVGEYRPDPRMLWRFVRVGAPAASATALFALIYVVVMRFIAQFGPAAVAGLGVGLRGLESITFAFCFGLSVASATLVGQCLGARDPDRAARTTWAIFGLGAIPIMAGTTLFLLFSRELAGLLSGDAEVIEYAASYIRIIGAIQIFMCLEFVLAGAFRGAGNTMPVLIVQTLGTALRIPLAWSLAFAGDYALGDWRFSWGLGLGITGVWFAIAASSIIRGLWMAAWFRRGRWRHAQV